MTITEIEDITITELAPFEEPASLGEFLAHIVNPPKNLHIWQPGMTSQEMVTIARMRQIPLEALCGYQFIPKHNPEPLDACTTCIDIAGDLMRGKGE